MRRPVPPSRGSRSWGLTVAAVVALLAVANVMSNRVLPSALYVPWNLLVAVAVALLGLQRARRPRELGFAEWRAWRGVRRRADGRDRA